MDGARLPCQAAGIVAAVHPRVRTPLLVMAAVTLLVTIVRLAGERTGGPSWLFGRAAGGGGSLLGIGWLIPVAGFWFGRRLAAAGLAPQHRRRALGLVACGLACIAVVFTLAKTVLGVTVATFVFVAIALPLSTIFAFRAWPELARALFVYALSARLPILVLTVVAVAQAWGTHYELLAPGSPPMGDAARTAVLCTAQLCLWVPLTVQVGCLAGLAAASFARRPG